MFVLKALHSVHLPKTMPKAHVFTFLFRVIYLHYKSLGRRKEFEKENKNKQLLVVLCAFGQRRQCDVR